MFSVLTALFPPTFPVLALAHFLALLSPGPDFFLVVGHATRRKFRGSAFICVGIAAGNALYIVLAIAGWAGLRHSTTLYSLLEAAGVVYLTWMGLMLLRSSRKAMTAQHTETAPLSPAKQFCAGLLSSITNPKNAIFYLSLMTVIIGPSTTLLQQGMCGLWMVTLVLGWNLGLAACIAHPAVQRALYTKLACFEGVAGAMLLCVAGGVAWSALARVLEWS